MSYPPNILAAEYIIKQIVPVLVKKNIKFKLLLCGSSPGRKLQRYQSDNILIQGWVDDIRIPYSKSKIFIAPIEIGAGMQNKILEAISCKIPCITSELVNKGINMPEGSIIIASGPEDYAEKIILLLGNKELYDSLTNNAFDYINKTYNWKIISEKLNYFLKYLE
jgi:glycosyltransferase involved in cell wall biosynthesis